MSAPAPAVALFAPHPVLTVTLEVEGREHQSIHFHAGGQGVWAAAMIAAMGARPLLCGFIGGEVGDLLAPLVRRSVGDGEALLVPTATASGCYVTDRRSGTRNLLAMSLSEPPSRHELDELLSRSCSEALASGWLVVTNPLPGESLPLEVYGDLVANARAGGARTLVDLSPPRLDSALASEPDLVKINDWELASFVRGPVDTPAALLAGARRVQEAGAANVVITRGELPALVLEGERPWRLTTPHFDHGFREGCGDAMMGALAGVWACGSSLHDSLVLAAAAGAANFLRRGLGHASREVVTELAQAVTLEPWQAAAAA